MMRFKNISFLTGVCITGVLWLAGAWRSSSESRGSDVDTGASFVTGQEADLMLSGVDFNSAGGPLLFNHPTGIASDGTRFVLCDRFNNRILIWTTLPDRGMRLRTSFSVRRISCRITREPERAAQLAGKRLGLRRRSGSGRRYRKRPDPHLEEFPGRRTPSRRT